MAEIPEKHFYKINEVCRYTDTQPYVLRFWESEFPQLAPRRNQTGQKVYRRADLDLVFRIKKLLYEEEYTIAGARKLLEEESHGSRMVRASGPTADLETQEDWPADSPTSVPREERDGQDSPQVGSGSYKASYERAKQEIEVLRRRLAEAEEREQKIESALEESEQTKRAARERSQSVASSLEALLESLAPPAKRRGRSS